ncbi:hypothetical protein PIB30_042776 [Stylosanthes scabra]|uniref:Ribonuclease H1 N-terminal domain-containing protein n=1 Tax=Stylosanthes scabra TaxID=79078 RepID=A0ABU6YH79_9FABA|nr:hypothetical protein [Stylosanthes scabra]
MGKSGGRYSHYAIKVGRVPGIYSLWDEAEEHVSGFPFAKFKGFNNLDEALAYMRMVPSQKMKGPVEQNVDVATLHLQNLVVGSAQSSVSQSGSRLSMSRFADGSREVDSVPEAQGGAFIIVEKMELYLLRACTKLCLGCPIIKGCEFYSYFGTKIYAFTAELRCDEGGPEHDRVVDSGLQLSKALCPNAMGNNWG